ncbi:hypothetical protein CLOM_g21216 [Closterium sp. NIES-68]|nr:hypothetical protein CLOM_g21216 [Closterium sp. NIES-68]
MRFIPAERGIPTGGAAVDRRCLASYADCVAPSDWPLAWTAVPVLAREAFVPPQFTWLKLGLKSPPPLTLVLTHLKVLGRGGGEETLARWPNVVGGKSVEEAFEQIFRFLSSNWGSLDSPDIRSLKPVSLVPVANGTRLVPASALFARLGPDLAPYLFELPRRFLPFSQLLVDLGMHDSPSPSALSSFLSALHRSSGGQRLNPNELRAVLNILRLVCEGEEGKGGGAGGGGRGGRGGGGGFISPSLLSHAVIPDDSCRLVPAHTCVMVDPAAIFVANEIDPRCLRLAHPLLPPSHATKLGIPSLSQVIEQELDPSLPMQQLGSVGAVSLGNVAERISSKEFATAAWSILHQFAAAAAESTPSSLFSSSYSSSTTHGSSPLSSSSSAPFSFQTRDPTPPSSRASPSFSPVQSRDDTWRALARAAQGLRFVSSLHTRFVILPSRKVVPRRTPRQHHQNHLPDPATSSETGGSSLGGSTSESQGMLGGNIGLRDIGSVGSAVAAAVAAAAAAEARRTDKVSSSSREGGRPTATGPAGLPGAAAGAIQGELFFVDGRQGLVFISAASATVASLPHVLSAALSQFLGSPVCLPLAALLDCPPNLQPSLRRALALGSPAALVAATSGSFGSGSEAEEEGEGRLIAETASSGSELQARLPSLAAPPSLWQQRVAAERGGMPGEVVAAADVALLQCHPLRPFHAGEVVAWREERGGGGGGVLAGRWFGQGQRQGEGQGRVDGKGGGGGGGGGGMGRVGTAEAGAEGGGAIDLTPASSGSTLRYGRVVADVRATAGQALCRVQVETFPNEVRLLLSSSILSFKSSTSSSASAAAAAATASAEPVPAVSSPRSSSTHPSALPPSPGLDAASSAAVAGLEPPGIATSASSAVPAGEVVRAVNDMLAAAGIPLGGGQQRLLTQLLTMQEQVAAVEAVLAQEQARAEQAEREAEAAKAAWNCRICLAADVSAVLVPCGHVLCASCIASVHRCPFCRSHVAQTVRLFRP